MGEDSEAAGSSFDDAEGCLYYDHLIALSCRPRAMHGRETSAIAFIHAVGFSDVSVNTLLIEPDESGLRVPGSFRQCVFQLQPAQTTASRPDAAAAGSGAVATLQQQQLRPVRFGEAVQLKHVASGKVMAARPGKLSASSSECMMLELSSHADENCFFEVQPRFKHRSDGDIVLLSDQITLFATAVRRFVNSQVSNIRQFSEVNLSVNSSSWNIQTYSAPSNMVGSNLCGGDVIRLFHFDCESFMVFAPAAEAALVVLQTSIKVSSSSMASAQAEHIDTNSYWEIESEDATDGGLIEYSKPYRLRHVNTGKYLALEESAAINAQQGSGDAHSSSFVNRAKSRAAIVPARALQKATVQNADLTEFEEVADVDLEVEAAAGALGATLTDRATQSTLFAIMPSNSVFQQGNAPVKPGASVRLMHINSGKWVHGSHVAMKLPGAAAQPEASPAPSAAKAATVSTTKTLTYPLSAVPDTQEQDVFLLSSADRHDMNDTMFLLGAFPCLDKYVHAMRRGRRPPAGLADQTATFLPVDVTVIDDVLRVVDDLMNFLTGSGEFTVAGHPADGEQPVTTRQMLMAEHVATDIVVAMLTAPFAEWDGPLPMHGKLHPSIREVCQLCYELLILMFKDNSANEIMAAKHTAVFVRQTGCELGAELALTALFNNNLTLIEQLPRVHVQAFVNLLRSKGRKAMYINFLTALCSFKGEGVPGKQELLCDILFGNNDGAYSREDTQHLGITSPDVPGADLIIPVRSEGNTLMVCQDNTTWVTFSDFYASRHPSRHYMTATLKLLTEMCISRNYVCILEVSAMFTRQALNATMWDTSLSADVRAALCKLCLVMYIDVKPNAPLSVADRTRLWNKAQQRISVLSGGIAPKLSREDANWFGALCNKILQFFASPEVAHLTDDGHSAADSQFVLALLQLTKKLLQFGLFLFADRAHASSEDTPLHQLCKSLITVLDCRTTSQHQRRFTQAPGAPPSTTSLDAKRKSGSVVQAFSPRGGVPATPSKHAAPAAQGPDSTRSRGTSFFGESSTAPAAHDTEGALQALQSFRLNKSAAANRSGRNFQSRHAKHIVTDEEEQGEGVVMASVDHKMLVEECRETICTIFEFVALLRADFLMAQVLGVFYENFIAFLNTQQIQALTAEGWDLSSGFPQMVKSSRKSVFEGTLPAREDVIRKAMALHTDCQWDLQKLCGDDMDEVMLDLLKFSHDGLTSASLQLLLEYFGSQVTVNRLLREVQLLVSPSTVAAYNMAQSVLPRLQMFVETTETWMGIDSEDDLETCAQVRLVLEQLADLMWLVSVDDATATRLMLRSTRDVDTDGIEDVKDGESQTTAPQAANLDVNSSVSCILSIYSNPHIHADFVRVDPERQQLLQNMGFPSLVVNLLQQGAAMLTNRQNQSSSDVMPMFMEELVHTLSHCYRFLHIFVSNSERNRQLLAPHVDLFTQLMSQGVWAGGLLGSIFHDNTTLIKDVKEFFVRRLVDILTESGKVPGLLEPLISVVQNNGQCIDANAVMVLANLMDKKESAVPMLHTTPADLQRLLQDHRSVGAVFTQNVPDEAAVKRFQPRRRPDGWARDARSSIASPGTADALSETARAVPPPASHSAENDTVLQNFAHDLEINELAYYAKLLELFADLAHSNNLVVINALRALFPLNATLQVVQAPWMIMPIATQLLRILDSLWLLQRPNASEAMMAPPLTADDINLLISWLTDSIEHMPVMLSQHSASLQALEGTQPHLVISNASQKDVQELQRLSARRHLMEALIPTAAHLVFAVNDHQRMVSLAHSLVTTVHEWGCAENASGSWTTLEADAVFEACMAATHVLKAPWWTAPANEQQAIERQLTELENKARRIHRRKSDALRDTNLAVSRTSSMGDKEGPRQSDAVPLPGAVEHHGEDDVVTARPHRKASQVAGSHGTSSGAGVVLADSVEAAFKTFVHELSSACVVTDAALEELIKLDDSEPDVQFVEFVGALARGGSSVSTDVKFQDRMNRGITFARNIGSNPTPSAQSSLDLILRTIRVVIGTGFTAADQLKLQDVLTDQGAVLLLHELLLQGPRNRAQFDSVLSTAIEISANGNTNVQGKFLQLWSVSNGALQHMNNILMETTQALRDARDTQAQADALGVADGRHSESVIKQTVMLVLEFIQSMCEGHNLASQSFLREQPTAKRSVNLVAATVGLLYAMQQQLRAELVPCVIQALNTLIELVQGPCGANQVELVNRKIVEAASSLLSVTDGTAGVEAGIIKVLHHRCSLLMTSLFEGRGDTLVHSRVAAVLANQATADAMKQTMVRVYKDFLVLHQGVYTADAFMQEFRQNVTEPAELSNEELANRAVLETGFGVYILFRNLLDYDPMLHHVIQAPPSDGQGMLLDVPDNQTDPESVIQLNLTNIDFGLGGGRPSISEISSSQLYKAALQFFDERTRSVEIIRESRLEKFYFPEPPMCRHLTEQTREAVIWEIDRSSAIKKIQGLFEMHKDFINEMVHQQRLQKLFAKGGTFMNFVPSPGSASFRTLCFTFTVIINVLILICFERDPDNLDAGIGGCDSTLFGVDTGVPWGAVISVFQYFQLALGASIAGYNLINFAPLIAAKARKEGLAKAAVGARGKGKAPVVENIHTQDPLSWTSIGGVVQTTHKPTSITHQIRHILTEVSVSLGVLASLASSPLMFWVFFVIFSLLGVILHPYFSALCLLELISRFEELRLVLRSITRPAKTLTLTAILFIVFEYYFAIIGFVFYVNNYRECNKWDGEDCVNQCMTLFSCFITTFDQGFKNNGGVGAYLGPNLHRHYDTSDSLWGGRFVYDNLYNIILLTVMLNIVFGLIIDTFADLRTQKKEKEDDMLGCCFICNIDRSEFDRKGKGFLHHIREDHRMWYYIYLIVHLLHKPRTELTGVEDYLHRMVLQSNVSFFPMHRALVLNHTTASSGDEDSHDA